MASLKIVLKTVRELYGKGMPMGIFFPIELIELRNSHYLLHVYFSNDDHLLWGLHLHAHFV